MNILIPDNWLREFVETQATPKQIAKYVSLSGPTIDRLNKNGKNWVYDVEVTTNRVDAMSVNGFAREVIAILPRFGIKATLKKQKSKMAQKETKLPPLDIKVVNNPNLCKRILAVKLVGVKLGPSPNWMQERLIAVGQRPLVNAIDITNYAMWELGHPIHAFDYDRITEKKIVVREAKKGEKLITLENKEYVLRGGEVVFDNGEGEIIDLPGIMGTANTVVTKNTKNILLWIESVKADKIRNASMGLNIRSQAAVLNEKHVDPELATKAIDRAIDLFNNVANARSGSKLLDIYPNKQKAKVIKINKNFIDDRLGVDIDKHDISRFLTPLGFKSFWTGSVISVNIPTFRLHDMTIPEDVVEEIARIYGYHNLPSKILDTIIPDKPTNQPFIFENKIRNILSGFGGTEVYTLSLVPKEFINSDALRLKNPLGSDTEYLRTSLLKSLVEAAKKNTGLKKCFHLFEIANIYVPQKNNLPSEKMTLAGIFSGYNFRDAKGVIESLLNKLHINGEQELSELKYFVPSKRILIISKGSAIGSFGVLEENDYIYYEFQLEKLQKYRNLFPTFKKISKYPPQIEDITLKLPDKTRINEVIQSIKSSDKQISSVELGDIYKNSYTFRIEYQNTKKTLTDKEVEKIRTKLLKKVKIKFGAISK